MCEADSADRKDTEAQVLGLAAEVCQRYRLIAVPWLNEHTKKTGCRPLTMTVVWANCLDMDFNKYTHWANNAFCYSFARAKS